MSADNRIVRHVVVRGRGQGVGYRIWTEYAAVERGLEGWVRNRMDGSVEAVFAGAAVAVEGMLEACRRGGPPGAHVDAMDVREAGAEVLGERRPGERFSVRSTV
jgi:acylphosphatase